MSAVALRRRVAGRVHEVDAHALRVDDVVGLVQRPDLLVPGNHGVLPEVRAGGLDPVRVIIEPSFQYYYYSPRKPPLIVCHPLPVQGQGGKNVGKRKETSVRTRVHGCAVKWWSVSFQA